uniref:Uncharacterized protein n=1 Tax=Odontella aurita TaxID=265563 RepID=A0A7S4MJL1_9STRA|mmetsp:Transcript_23755/g.70243  ORF Transcript_23755/g.70243 Transcript_23755/m.70243 type:complete len:128 (+) Transcript_23755:253-636(+)
MPRTKIAADGSIVSEDDSGAAARSTSSGAVSSGTLSSIQHIDVFGFNLDLKQFVVVLALAGIMLGTKGVVALLLALVAFTLFQRATAGVGEGSGGGSSGARRGGWGRSGGGSNIRGVKDLPKPPPRG